MPIDNECIVITMRCQKSNRCAADNGRWTASADDVAVDEGDDGVCSGWWRCQGNGTAGDDYSIFVD